MPSPSDQRNYRLCSSSGATGPELQTTRTALMSLEYSNTIAVFTGHDSDQQTSKHASDKIAVSVLNTAISGLGSDKGFAVILNTLSKSQSACMISIRQRVQSLAMLEREK